MQPWWPFCARLPLAGRGVTDLLSLSLEARALSGDAGGPADDEVVDTAIFLPVSVASPISSSWIWLQDLATGLLGAPGAGCASLYLTSC